MYFLLLLLPYFVYSCGEVKSSQSDFSSWLWRSSPTHSKYTQRIIGGVKSESGAWPWQVLIKYKDYVDGQEYLCGGALISNKHVLTAAHCTLTMNMPQTRIYLGTDTANPEPGQAVSTNVIHKIVHPLYSSNERVNPSQLNDIAILTFKPSVIFSDRISPVCIPGPNFTLMDFGYVTGYGAFNKGTWIIPKGSDYLQQSLMPVVDYESCNEKWQNDLSDFGGGFPINNRTQICAGAVGHGSAQGDSGGPFVQQSDKGKWYQVGIVSFGINMGKGYYDQALAPGVYTRVSSYCDWIIENTEGLVDCGLVKNSLSPIFLFTLILLIVIFIL